MQINLLKYSALALGTMALMSAPYTAQAQTENVDIDVIVSNQLTVVATQQLDFGIFAMVSDTGQEATVTVSTAGAASAATDGGTAGAAVIDDTDAQQAIITVAGGANGVAFNLEIDNAVNPFQGAVVITLDDFVVMFNAVADNDFVIGTAEALTFDSSFGSGTNTVQIGATLTSVTPQLATPAYPDGLYDNGTYDVIFSY